MLEALPALALPAACSWRDWANWESSAAASALRGWMGLGPGNLAGGLIGAQGGM